MAFLISEQRKYKSLSNLLFTNHACSLCLLLPFLRSEGWRGEERALGTSQVNYCLRARFSLYYKGSLSKDVFERRTSTGSEAFSLYICLDANKFIFLNFFSLIKRIYPRVSTEPLPDDAKSPLPVDVRCSKTLLLKLPNNQLPERRSNSGCLLEGSSKAD